MLTHTTDALATVLARFENSLRGCPRSKAEIERQRSGRGVLGRGRNSARGRGLVGRGWVRAGEGGGAEEEEEEEDRRRVEKTKMKGREERRVKRVDIASVVDGEGGEEVFGVESSSERSFVSA